MSYIRCLSNPEGLYIVDCGQGIEIYIRGEEWRIPRKTFHRLFLKWDDYRDEMVTFRGAALRQTEDFRWELGYKGWHRPIVMWETTVRALVESVKSHETFYLRLARKKRR